MSENNHHRLENAVEAIIFAADEPVTTEALRITFGEVTGADVDVEDVEEAIARLNAAYEVEGHAIRIHHWGGGFRMATEESMTGFVKAFLLKEEEKRLSRALLETLSVVAYKQPTSKPEVDHVRGVQSDYAIGQLLERDFITIVGRAESVGRPLLYGTTEHFLDQFGLGTLEELPRPREIDELLEDPAFSKERAMLTSEMAMMEIEAAHDAETQPEGAEKEKAEIVDGPANAADDAVDVIVETVDLEELDVAEEAAELLEGSDVKIDLEELDTVEETTGAIEKSVNRSVDIEELGAAEEVQHE